MSGKSATTRVIAIRLHNEIVEILTRRGASNKTTLSDYLRKGIIHDVTRKHRRRTNEIERDNMGIREETNV